MAEKLLLLALVYIVAGTFAQHSSYSLQDAVEALRRREAQLALRNNFNEAPSSHFLSPPPPPPSEDEEYWPQDPAASPPAHLSRHQLNKLLARYLARDEDERERDSGLEAYETDFDDENYFPVERKRSFFRERGGKYEPPYASVFRERELVPYETPELAEEFLREIEHEKDIERERNYKEALQRLWEKYEQQENEIKEDLFDDDEKKKRQLLPYLSPMEKKRSYPVLPWLPVDNRKKRFPISKRSPRAPNEASFGASGTDDKVAHDLEAIFNEHSEEKKKRSAESSSSTTTSESPSQNNAEKKTVTPKAHHSERNHHGHGHGEENVSEEDSHETEHDRAHDHDHDEDEEDDHDFDDEDDEDRKKKREVDARKQRSTQEVVREDQIIPGDLSDFRKKKATDWSQYFGIDRRKKSVNWFMRNGNEMKKRSAEEQDDKRKKKATDEEKLENMNKKLKIIEDLIIDETVKYTGAHEGIGDPEEIQRLKDHVVSRLATAYSLEKMRRALDKLKQSVENENHLQRNEIELDPSFDEKEKQKRVAVKKDKAELENNQHSSDQQHEKESHEHQQSQIDENDEDKRKKKKRNGEMMYHRHNDFNVGDFEDELGAGHIEPQLYEGYPVSRSYNYLESSSQCPMLDAMAERCRGVDLLSGDIRQEFLPICGIHQLCYLCGTSQTACDFQYLSEADSICGRNNECQSAARAALMILRGTPGPQLGPKECMKNHCLYRSMKEIGL